MAAGADQKTKQLYEFGPFRVDSEKELLLRDNEAIPIAPKAFQVLLVLMHHKKEIVTKDELLKAVWPDTFVEETNLSRNIFLLRKALGESLHDHQYILTVPGHGYRFAEDVQLVPEQELNIVAASHAKVEMQVEESKPWGWIVAAAVLLVAVALGAYKLLVHRSPVLTEKDTVVLADFTNSTGDPVFDGALREGLAVELEQSPFLSLISDQRIQQTLQLMGRPANAGLTPEIAREICERTASTAVLNGSIAQIGNEYLLTLKAVSCVNGESMASAESTAKDKNHVLDAMGSMASAMRGKLGESLSTVQRFDTPLEQATTGSLEALQAYSLGRREMLTTNWKAAVPFFQRAVQLDPNFAMAYARLGMSYRNYGEGNLGSQYARKAYMLRDRTSQLERFYIESHYYIAGVGDFERGAQVCRLWARTYPRDWVARVDLSDIYADLGQHDRARAEAQDALRLNPNGVAAYHLLFVAYLNLNRFSEARHWSEEAKAKGFESPNLSHATYQLYFVQNDAAGMAELVTRSKGKRDEQGLMDLEATTAAYFGRLKEARDHSGRATLLANLAGDKELAAASEGSAALSEAFFENWAEARKKAATSLALSNGRGSQFDSVLALAISGDISRAERLADDLDKRFPEDTLFQSALIPIIRAQIALSLNKPARAVELLQAATPYELGQFAPMYSAYLRGEAFLASHQGAKAAVEFQRILDHRGVVVNDPTGALAHLQLGRAYALMGENAKSRTAYQEFLTLWKDADSDIPILQQARIEYAKLK